MTAAAPTTPAMVPMIVTHDTRSIKRIMTSVEQAGRTLAVNPAPSFAAVRCRPADRLSAHRPIARIGQAWQGLSSVLLEECEIVNLMADARDLPPCRGGAPLPAAAAIACSQSTVRAVLLGGLWRVRMRSAGS